MRALLIWSRADARRRIGTLLGLALLIALAGGATMATLAGARRASTAYERLRERTLAMDAAVFGSGPSRRAAVADGRVAASARFAIAAIAFVGNRDLFPFIEPRDDAVGRTIERPLILAGRRADPSAPHEVVLPEGVARSNGLAVGDRMRFVSVARGDAASVGSGPPVAKGPRFTLRIVGISRSAAGLAVRDRDLQFVYLTPAWVERYGPRIAVVGEGTVVRLRGGPDAFGAWSRSAVPEADASSHPTPLFSAAPVEDSIAVIVDGLRLFALVAAIAGLVAVVQAVERHASGSVADLDVLRGLGATRRERATAMLLAVAPAVGLGAVGALVLASAWSPFMPIGLARRAEPDPGWSFDAAVLAGGAAIVLFLVGLVSAFVAWRVAGRSHAARPSTPRSRVSFAALPPVPATGFRLATARGHGRDLVPVRSAVAGVAVAIAGVVAVGGFAAGLGRLVSHPARYGVPWDATVTHGRDEAIRRDVARLEQIAQVGEIAVVHAQLEGLLDGRSDGTGAAVEPVRGSISPVTRSGSVPSAPGEIALGADSAARLGVGPGDHVTLTGSGRSRRMTVVGEALLPTVDDPALVASGFLVTPATARSLGLGRTDDAFRRVVVRFRPGVSRAAGLRALRAGGFDVSTPAPPPEVARLREVQSLPRALAAILAVIGAVVLGLALIVTVRRRRRDLALLRVLGFTGRQVVGSVLWQAAIVAAVGLVVGIPVGLALGRFVWERIADALGVATDPAASWAVVGITVLGAFVVAGGSAVLPAARAARMRPASILREE